MASLTRWLAEPEYRVISTLYFCRRIEGQGGLSRLLARWLWRRYVIGAGVLISPLAVIGQNLRLPHPIGIVVSEEARIADRVTLYQNVTLGRRTASLVGAPTIGDDVVIYAGAVVAGPVSIGSGAVIGANAVVMEDVPPGATAAGNPARIIAAAV